MTGGLLRATAVTRGGGGGVGGGTDTEKESAHQLDSREKNCFLLLLPGFELATFGSRIRRPYQQAVPAHP